RNSTELSGSWARSRRIPSRSRIPNPTQASNAVTRSCTSMSARTTAKGVRYGSVSARGSVCTASVTKRRCPGVTRWRSAAQRSRATSKVSRSSRTRHSSGVPVSSGWLAKTFCCEDATLLLPLERGTESSAPAVLHPDGVPDRLRLQKGGQARRTGGAVEPNPLIGVGLGARAQDPGQCGRGGLFELHRPLPATGQVQCVDVGVCGQVRAEFVDPAGEQVDHATGQVGGGKHLGQVDRDQ